MSQMPLPLEPVIRNEIPQTARQGSFSHDAVCEESARLDLENKYSHLIEVTEKFSRKTVSFQANKVSTLHGWIKYREGFSAQLIEILLSEFGIKSGHTILDPFAGSCTALLEAKLSGINAIGVELLPNCHLAWDAKSRVFDYDLAELRAVRDKIRSLQPPTTGIVFPHLAITAGAFPERTERAIVDYAAWFQGMGLSDDAYLLCQALLMSTLEDVSYTRKDGQYLRWDERAEKIVQRNISREARGKKPMKGIDKGVLPNLKDALLSRFDVAIRDISEIQLMPRPTGYQELVKGNALYELPLMEGEVFDAVITSPPYANRYDYTRTYALELAFLKVERRIFQLRQEMLSCTVENKSKRTKLAQYYETINASDRYQNVMSIVDRNAALNEIGTALKTRSDRGEINNRGVLRMITQYFTELAFVYAELFRVCKSGAWVAFVNDNVRYAGEVIPVDMISTNLAEIIGFVPKRIYVLHQRKGNSSQQMRKFGRRELRKSVTIWQKP